LTARAKPAAPLPDGIVAVRGARQHNLKNIDVDLPRGRLTVITGVSGSGKSSLAFDTLYAEGQRRYVESVSTYAKQFLDRMERPDLDSVSGLAPAVAIQQANQVKSARSTVGTATEIYDYLRLLFARIGETFCGECGERVSADHPSALTATAEREWTDGEEVAVLAPVALPPRLPWATVAEGLVANGFLRIWTAEGQQDLDPLPALATGSEEVLVVVDRMRWSIDQAPRLAEAFQSAFGRGEGRLLIARGGGLEPKSERWVGDVLEFDESLIIPDPSLTLSEGAVDPWAGSWRSIYSRRLREFSKRTGLPLDVPWKKLTRKQREQVMHGAEGLRGAIPFLERLQRKSYKAGNRFLVKRYQRPVRCRACEGSRLRPEARNVRIDGDNIVEVSRMPVSETLGWVERVDAMLEGESRQQAEPILGELLSRLRYLERVDLGYLTLDRLSRSLSGGEMQRIELANALGANLVDTLYVLDEPTVGLHARDTARLIAVLEDLTHRGNTLVVVEHDPMVAGRADWLVDLGPGAGEAGGQLLYAGHPGRLGDTPTGRYLGGEFQVNRRRLEETPERWLELRGARLHNLQGVTLRIPLGRLTCVTGVSGSGKSSLIEDTLYPAVARLLGFVAPRDPGPHDELVGLAGLDRVVLVDQSPIGKSPRSNPVTYIKAFGVIRDVFAAQPLAAERGYKPGTFSFNVEGGRCEACRGEGAVKVEMYFLADLYVPCEECGGTRFRRQVLEVRFRGRNIHEVLDLTVDEAREAFRGHDSVVNRLQILSRVGLGYLRLGQPATTLSGGESQRLKIARELSEPVGASTLYLLDEPTVGLHATDVQILLDVLSDLVDRGGTVILVEHQLDVVRNADWVVDLGPGGGAAGGRLVAEGTPDEIAGAPESETGRYLAAQRVGRRAPGKRSGGPGGKRRGRRK
jgi:excinuclease ABC subunit A